MADNWFRSLLDPEDQARRRQETNRFLKSEWEDVSRVLSYLDSVPDALASAATNPTAPGGFAGHFERAGQRLGSAVREGEQYETEGLQNLDPAMRFALSAVADPSGPIGDAAKLPGMMAAIMPFLRASKNNPKIRKVIEEAANLPREEQTPERFMEMLGQITGDTPYVSDMRGADINKFNMTEGLGLALRSMDESDWYQAGRDVRNAPEVPGGVYVEAMENIDEVGSMDNARAMANVMDLLDAMNLPAMNHPAPYMPPGGDERFTAGALRSMYNRADFTRATAARGEATPYMYRDPMPTTEPHRSAEAARRLDPELQIQHGRRANPPTTNLAANQRAREALRAQRAAEQMVNNTASPPAGGVISATGDSLLAKFPDVKTLDDAKELRRRGLLSAREFAQMAAEIRRR